jgi:hypothetical protein
MKIFGLIKEAKDELLWRFTYDVHNLILDKYYSTYWRKWNDTGVMTATGHKPIADKVNKLNPKTVLDVGCGYNEYKPHINCDEFVGIDPYNDAADVKQGIYEYYQNNKEKQFDVLLVLGSLNFGPYDKLIEEIDVVDKMTVPGGRQYWRVNPGIPHVCPEFPLAELIEFFDWTEEFIKKIANMYGYEIEEFGEEVNKNGDKRYYFCFHKV